jgi:hypothetical protein
VVPISDGLPAIVTDVVVVLHSFSHRSEILGSHGGEYEDGCLLSYCAVLSGRSLPMIQRCLLPPTSGR